MGWRDLFSTSYDWTLTLKPPGEERRTVTMAGRSFEEYSRAVFEAGMEFGAAHPDLQVKAGTWR